MLEHAPSKSGKRYVATVLHIAYTKGMEDVKKSGRCMVGAYVFQK